MKGKVFTAQEVQAIIAGNKTQFREVIKEIGNIKLNSGCSGLYFGKCPYEVGQKIFCKETFCPVQDEAFEGYSCEYFPEEQWVDYRATPRYEESHPAGWHINPKSPNALKWKPAQHMKQEHSRLILLIKEIKVERLGDISEEDCWKEGLEEFADYQDQVKICEMAKQLGECIEDPRPCFATWWNATHNKPEEKFEANPWVWKIEFKVGISFLMEELIKTTKFRTFCKYKDLPEPLMGNLSELFDEGFCKTYSELDADGNEIGSFKLERIEIGHVAEALDSGEFSKEKESILQLFYDFMKKMNIEFIEDL